MIHPPPGVSLRAARAAQRASRDGSWNGDAPASLEEVVAGIGICRRCERWRGPSRGVAGEGPARAALMLVGDQPFTGPAGRVLDQALTRVGAPRGEVFVTSAVKHSQPTPGGGRRSETQDAAEVAACRWWLDAERRLVRPRVIVAMGAVAALAVFGRPTPIEASRSRTLPLDGGARGVVTYHPFVVLRAPDEMARASAFAALVRDLRFAWTVVG